MLAMITREIRRQWERPFTLDDALLCVYILLPVGMAAVLVGVTVNF